MTEKDKNYWISWIHKVAQPGDKSTLEGQIALLKAAIDPGCPYSPDIEYYVGVMAARLAQYEQLNQKCHADTQAMKERIRNQRAELTRLHAIVKQDNEIEIDYSDVEARAHFDIPEGVNWQVTLPAAE